jgi:ferric-dicitrate binding protein FerR (iron transport regulator)
MLLLAVGLSVSLQAQTQPFASVIELEGQVSVIRHGVPVALFQKGTVGDPTLCLVNAREEIVTGSDGHAIFQIADGSSFEVFPNSRVSFQDKWTIEDMLTVLLGRIRVQIEHRNGPNHKKVQTPTAVISVRGTVFDVNVEDEDGTTYVSVEEGQIEVRHALLGGAPKILNQNQSVRIYANQPLAQATSPGPAMKFWFDRLKNAVLDIVLNNPGGVMNGGGGGGVPAGGPQADSGKTKKNPPTTAPPGGGQ